MSFVRDCPLWEVKLIILELQGENIFGTLSCGEAVPIS